MTDIEKYREIADHALKEYTKVLEERVKKVKKLNPIQKEYIEIRDRYIKKAKYIQTEILDHCGCNVDQARTSLKFIYHVLNNLKHKNLDALFYGDMGIKYTVLYILSKYGLIDHTTGDVTSSNTIELKGALLLRDIEELFSMEKSLKELESKLS